MALEAIDYKDSIISTVKYEIVSAVIEILICSFIAYGLARFDFKGKKFLNFVLLLTILVPVQMIIVPIMTNYSQLDVIGILGLLNRFTGIDLRPNILGTVWTFYLPSIFGVGLRSGILIYIYIQFFSGLPKELEEAAWIDGAGLFRTFFSIAVPSSSVVYTTVTLFALIWHWNDYYLAVMYLSDKFPLAVRIYDIDNLITAVNIWGGGSAVAIKSAACFMFIAPMLVIYLFMQRKFVQSIDRVGITG
ncbi:MAG: carbohydrate ABC transporter permease [Oscillospiraceae bacterium]